MTNYVNVFGGEVSPPSDFGYQATTFAVDTTSFWPYNYAGTGCILAKNNDLTASVAALSLTLPDASQVSTGEDFILKNAGAETFTVKDAGGNVLTTIIAGVAKYFVLTNNSTTAGVYAITTFGTGTSSADAATLAGAGHRVNSTAIDNITPATLIANPYAYTISSVDNAQTLVVTSGTTSMALPNPATLYNGYFFFFTNSGSGTITFDPYAAVTIDGSLTKNIQPGESCIVTTDGLNYYTVGYGRSNTYTWTQLSVDLTGVSSYTVTSTQAANKLWEFAGVPTGNITITIPAVASVYFVKVASIGGYTATFSTGSGATVALTSNQYFILSCDGINVSLAQTITNASTFDLDDGTVANPVISFLLDPDTGIYRIGANNMGIAAGGTLSASFTTAGINGALGASVPSTVSATSGTFSTTLSATGHTTFEGITSTGATGTGKIVYDNTPTLVTPALGTPSALVGTNITGTASGLSIGGNAATATTASAATGPLNGSLGATTPSTVVATDLTTTGNTILGNASTDTLNVGNGDLIKDASGNVGVGVTPSAWDATFKAIEIGQAGAAIWGSTSAGSSYLRMNNASYYNGTNFIYSGTGSAHTPTMYVQTSNGSNEWHTAPSGTAGNAITFTKAMTLDASGNLLVGTTSGFGTHTFKWSGANRFALNNTDATAGNNYGAEVRYQAAPNGTTNEFLYCSDSNGTTIRATIRSNGGLANFSANNVNLSDERVKKDIVDAGSYLDKICAIPVRTFLYKDQTDTQLNLGVIAQEVEAVAPELVDVSGFGETPEDGIPLRAIYQTDLQYALMKCIQEQQALITSLTARLEVLEAK